MANFQSVIDYLKDAPDAQNSKHMWKGDDSFKTTFGTTKSIDFAKMEKSLISPTEVNILKAFSSRDMFTLNDFNKGFELTVAAVADGSVNHRQLKKTNHVKLDFMSKNHWYLEPLGSHMYEAHRGLQTVGWDRTVNARVHASLNHIESVEKLGLPLTHTKQRMGVGHDLRHIFTKMVLYLNDYNLAVTSRITEKEISGSYQPVYYNNVSDEGRMELMRTKSVVVDSEHFTSCEVGFLALAAAEYPSVWFAGDNIYNAVRMEEDDIGILSSGEVKFDNHMSWHSPTELYHMICSIACKFGAVGDLATVLRDMRGRCKMMADMVSHTSGNVVVSDMPLSYSMDLGLGDEVIPPATQSKVGNYFATAQSLVHDLMVGMCFEASATTVVEDLGGLGKVFGSSNPHMNPILNGLCRDHGLKHMDVQKNVLLKNWGCVTGVPIRWGFGKMIKEYVLGLCDWMYNDTVNGDVLVPQLFNMLPFSYSKDSAWGMIRNWTGRGTMLLDAKKERVVLEQKTAAFSWAMGARRRRPNVFANYEGSQSLTLDANEMEFLLGSEGTFNINTIAFSLGQSLQGRVDETEESCTAFFKSEFIHTKCSLVYDIEHSWHQPSAVAGVVFEDRRSMRSSLWAHDQENKEKARREEKSRILPKVVPEPPAPTPTLERLQMLASKTRLEVDKDAGHAREDDDGHVRVPEFTIGGVTYDLQPELNRGQLKKGERVKVHKIDTPGDGRCGLHGVVKDLTVRGMCEKTQADRLLQRLDRDTGKTTWHEAGEIAAAVEKLGHGLEVYVPDESGGYGVQRYGRHDHYISLHLDQGHYSAAVVERASDGQPIGEVIDLGPGRVDEALVDSMFSVKKRV